MYKVCLVQTKSLTEQTKTCPRKAGFEISLAQGKAWIQVLWYHNSCIILLIYHEFKLQLILTIEMFSFKQHSINLIKHTFHCCRGLPIKLLEQQKQHLSVKLNKLALLLGRPFCIKIFSERKKKCLSPLNAPKINLKLHFSKLWTKKQHF